MVLVLKDGKYVDITEIDVNIQEEINKLNAWKNALINDLREIEEYNSKIAEINLLNIPNEFKEDLKRNVLLYSGSGITQAVIDEQQERVNILLQNGTNS